MISATISCSILLLAFGLVGFTVLAVALVAPDVFAGFDWRLGSCSARLSRRPTPSPPLPSPGASGCPAASWIFSKGRASSTTLPACSRFSSPPAIVVQKHVPTLSSGILTLAWLTAGGIGLGLIIGWIVD